MVENAGQNQDLLESLISDHDRRQLARDFITQVSTLPCVTKIVSAGVGQAEKYHQRIFVFTKGIETPESSDMDSVGAIYEKVCPSAELKRLLGRVPVVTEDLFEEDTRRMALLSKKATIIWQREN